MQDGDNRVLVFVLPFAEIVSNHVRALCLRDYAVSGWQFVYLQGTCPDVFNHYILRSIYSHWYYLIALSKLSRGSKKIVAYFIKPQSPFLLWVVKHILKIKVMIDINDPYHLPELMGAKTTSALFDNADRLIFESDEYCEYWAPVYSKVSAIVPDTPQHECVYTDTQCRGKRVVWVGSRHTAHCLIDFVKYFKTLDDHGYSIRLLGPGPEVLDVLRESSVHFSATENYDANVLAAELAAAFISFVPMPDDELFLLRGNLKAKVSMGYGCLTIASRNAMHQRLITHGVNGYLFDTHEEFERIVNEVEDVSLASCVAREGNKYVANFYSRKEHAVKLVQIADALSVQC